MTTQYEYSAADVERRFVEPSKGSSMPGSEPEHRGAFSRDRARVLHSAALRRLADKTQVVGPRDGDTPRTRLTHSLEVAQISRGIGGGLGLDQDLCELAALSHDIGHPPYGHNGEVALNQLADLCGGFEGNAQTLRILSRLEPKIMSGTESLGLNLTRASLDAACKYPWTREHNPRKYGAYEEDRELLDWLRDGHDDLRKPIEAQVMDWSDDIAYSVHDVEDGIVSGRIDLSVLWDLVELAALAEKGARAFGGEPEALIDAADRLRQLAVVRASSEYDASLSALVSLKAMTSELVGRYVGITVASTRAGNEVIGRQYGDLIVPESAINEVKLLKTIAVLYVMDDPGHLARQDRQRERINRVYDYLCLGAPGTLDPLFQSWYAMADSDAARQRVIIDQIASMTETRLERVAKNSAEVSVFFS
ncbi:Deoxyguanosinetriphosphate triphosphohydrolase [Corynebacterium kalinowskii]|uniref:Deoxyguanosinetriphosphate triphosphohydrolase-like protein n=1 Tax=Corynebacterium kalinowskii TaxID=2675216 RepID=A0A6B8VP82_9CORY|nr:deoxyguanosinetriphosphate triphosphohydrolase [Corynebacterium kalinowskii]QGU01611.1 Deoxyguanosinetriphosphate triphosphohydrolase [Corynebacterium kalinowskii]